MGNERPTPEKLTEMMSQVSYDRICEAETIVRQFFPPTSLMYSRVLSEELDADVFIKHEDETPVGAFKVRGGLYFMRSNLSQFKPHPDGIYTGVVCATRGNHGQSLAYAGREFNVPVQIVVPVDNVASKNLAMRELGGVLTEEGSSYDECKEVANRFEPDYYYVQSGNQPELINGVGTYAKEIFDVMDQMGRTIDYIFAPVGLGSGVSGILTVAEKRGSENLRVIGCQTDKAPSVYEAFTTGIWKKITAKTEFADGLATAFPEDLPMAIMKRRKLKMVLVKDECIGRGIWDMYRTTGKVAEGAAAVSLEGARLWKEKEDIKGKTVVLVMTGRNIDAVWFENIRRKYSKKAR